VRLGSRLLAGAALFAPAVLVLGAETPAVPRPHGWIGTAEDWARGLGLAFAALDLVVLALAWRTLRRRGETAVSKELLLGGIAVLPLAVVFFAYSYGLEKSKSVDACGHCHVMTPWVQDLRNPKSDTLAAVHFKNRYIQENHCYTCHSDYGMFGTVRAKWEGLGHVLRNTTGRYERPIHIARHYSNLRCLNCHGGSQKFLDPEKHPKEDLADMISGKTSCLDCHGPAHPKVERQAAR
jgi:nitrate/TMAO reductase-like tetraheme cytochrome c subunit